MRYTTLLALLALCIPATAQKPSDEVRSGSRIYTPGPLAGDPSLVPVGVVVRDSNGRAIAGLKAQDFRIVESGKEIPIATVQAIDRPAAGKQPHYIALCFDDYTGSNTLQRAKEMATRLVQDGLGPDDMVAVGSTFAKQALDFTSDRAKILGAIGRLNLQAAPAIVSPNASLTGRDRGPALPSVSATSQASAQGYVSQQAVILVGAFVNSLARQQGVNRTILLFSPGLQFMEGREQDPVISQAVRAGVIVNVVDTKDSFTEAKTAESASPVPAKAYNFEAATLGAEAAMAEFAQGTGGLFFHRLSESLSRGYSELPATPSTSYVLYAKAEAGDSKNHKIKVQLASASPAYAVESRGSYFPPSKDVVEGGAHQGDLRAALDQQVIAMKTVAEFPSTVQVRYGKLPNGNTGIQVLLHVDIKTLPFTKQGDRETQKIVFVAAIFDSQDKMVSAKEGFLDFTLPEAKYESLKESGVNASLTLEAPAGVYRLSTVTQDVQGKMASTLNAIQVP